jgi:hypothetical protein
MTCYRARGIAFVGFAWIVSGIIAAPWLPPARAAGDAPTANFYHGANAQLRHFRGRVVCLECDAAVREDAEVCAAHGHHHALHDTQSGDVVPMLAADAATLAQVQSAKLHGSDVTARGQYYPGAGVVVIEQIAPVVLAPIAGPHGGHD